MQITIHIGALAPTIEIQLEQQGFEASTRDIERAQTALDGVTNLLMQGYMPPSLANKTRDRIIKDLSGRCGWKRGAAK